MSTETRPRPTLPKAKKPSPAARAETISAVDSPAETTSTESSPGDIDHQHSDSARQRNETTSTDSAPENIPAIGSPFPSATESMTATFSRNILIDLGFPDLVDLNALGYMPSRPEVFLSQKAREAVKRLALTLEQQEATLADGTQVRNSASKSIVWLCERLADAISELKAA